ncbi:3-hydroxybutyrate-oligomer hydrolase [Cupriavidus necator]|uniref:3-hydroxybutyrate-oligomer hydrolase n=2 Tax=Cupriavidus necator (strain ATCC 17699 / DSM 428 / KCTC 22496 / NCIMB 10442 / H16 / Stanier 337) TaxID=381666 RepID=3HBOH_CUPNH|nr:alpha/beta hydrolase [Cupriavidus necator]Q4W8C9.2 RecName: Full=3-hydroxybutyrate-oligomer hydrolase; Short=3HB-oligomer hydrolase [Cupriavidus necator H16]QCC00363.1 alpha/beta hydrolase [Cupriavidus necator H16]QQB76819.1 alpha/beta hydrolase [Cupriavidus necator]WKA42223.1 alpha/beta hydrolase [Cupriavidus necator]CAJ92475.1 D-(-)-3-hydroxybutyrate oligomer hydrolase [Cupriavidus necator H16]
MSASPRLGFVQCISPAGLHRMAYHEWGDPANPRVLVCAHGLTRTGRDFDTVASALCGDYRVVCPDVAGRGRSEWLADANGYVVPQYVSDMVTLIARLNVEKVDWFGTSMGGLIGMGLAGLPKSPVRKLLLNDVGPKLAPSAVERIGAYLGLPVRFKTFEEGLAYLQTISASFGRHTPEQWRELNAAILKPVQGTDGLEWGLHYDPQLAVPFRKSTPEAIAAGEAALWRSFEAIEGPVLVVRGAQSDLLLRETVAEMVARGKHVSSVEVPDVGHAPTFVDPAQIAIAPQFFTGA